MTAISSCAARERERILRRRLSREKRASERERDGIYMRAHPTGIRFHSRSSEWRFSPFLIYCFLWRGERGKERQKERKDGIAKILIFLRLEVKKMFFMFNLK